MMDHHETGSALDDLVSSEKIRRSAFNFRPWGWICATAMKTPIVTNQIEISVLHHAPLKMVIALRSSMRAANGLVAFSWRGPV